MIIINGQIYEAEPAVEAYVKEIEQENKYHIDKIKSMYKEFEGTLRTPAWEYDMQCQLDDAKAKITELKAENVRLQQKDNDVIATDRDTPMKPIEVQGFMGDITLSCPSCKKPIVNCYSSRTFEPEFCICCGQRLLWSRKDGGAE
jgi:hypothetical protein